MKNVDLVTGGPFAETSPLLWLLGGMVIVLIGDRRRRARCA